MICSGPWYRQGQGWPSRKEGKISCYVNSPALVRTRTYNFLPSKVPGLAQNFHLPSRGLLSRYWIYFSVNKWKNPKCLLLLNIHCVNHVIGCLGWQGIEATNGATKNLTLGQIVWKSCIVTGDLRRNLEGANLKRTFYWLTYKHPQRAKYYLWDIWSDWLGDMTWSKQKDKDKYKYI